MIPDPVPGDAPGAREIGFSVPERTNASAVLFDNLARHPDRIALDGPAGRLTYAELCAEASRWGHAFASLGLRRGERILMFLDDTPAYPAALFGAMRAGFVAILVNTLTPPDLIRFYLEDSASPVAVVEAEFADRFDPAACAGTALRTVLVIDTPSKGVMLRSGEAASRSTQARGGSFETPATRAPQDDDRGGGQKPAIRLAAPLLAAQPATLDPADTHRNEMAFWMYSSGSTGRPKGIVHLHHDMAYTAASYARHVLALGPDDVCFSVPKIFFAYGFGNSLTFPFSVGASSVLLPGHPKPAAIYEAIVRYRPTVFFGLPTLYTALTKAPDAPGADLSSLRLAVSAAEILSAEVFNAWKSLSGLEIVEGLGSTEVLHIYLSNRPQTRKLGAAGLRVPGYEIELKDADGRPVADGEEGILWVRGDSNAPLYWNRPDKTAETMREGGWIYTGDRFVRDADGFHFFRGRADDLVKVSGQWVYPLEVELCLNDHPEVRECAVLALELADRRTTLKAFVVMNENDFDPHAATARLQDHVKRTLMPHKYPRQVAFLPDLPKTGTGKIDRQALLRIASEQSER